MNKLINGQSIVDKIVTAKHTIAGQDVAKAVLKATRDEISEPKRKHIAYLVACTDNPIMNILEMSKLLLDRAHNPHWTVSFKALITIHHIMNYGSSVFFQLMASNSVSLNFGSFSDTSNVVALHMSKYVRSYANYIHSKASSYRNLGLDFCKVKKGSEEGYFRKLEAGKLLESLFILQSQIDDLLNFGTLPLETGNELLSSAYVMLSKDLVRLYGCYKDAMTNMVGSFLRQDRKFCKEALAAYKKFFGQVDRIHEFFELSEDAGFNKFDIPKKLEISPDVLEAFENHLKSFDLAKKTSTESAVVLPGPEKKKISFPRMNSDVTVARRPRSVNPEEIFSPSLPLPPPTKQDKEKDLFEVQDLFKDSFNGDFSLQEAGNPPVVKNRPATVYSMLRDSDQHEVDFKSDNFWSGTTNSIQNNQVPTPPPGFVGSGGMLQPTKLYSSPVKTLSSNDLFKLTIGPSSIGQGMLSPPFPGNNLQNHNHQFRMSPGAGNGTSFSSGVASQMSFPVQSNLQFQQQQQQQRSLNPFL